MRIEDLLNLIGGSAGTAVKSKGGKSSLKGGSKKPAPVKGTAKKKIVPKPVIKKKAAAKK